MAQGGKRMRAGEEELFRLCAEIQEIDGRVTVARLREAAGGGSHARLKSIVEAWAARSGDATADAAPPGDQPSLEDAEQARIAMEAGRLQAALEGAAPLPSDPQELTDHDHASLPAALTEVAEVLRVADRAPPEPAPPEHAAEIARLKAHVEDLRRENDRLWEQVRAERAARIREIELLTGL